MENSSTSSEHPAIPLVPLEQVVIQDIYSLSDPAHQFGEAARANSPNLATSTTIQQPSAQTKHHENLDPDGGSSKSRSHSSTLAILNNPVNSHSGAAEDTLGSDEKHDWKKLGTLSMTNTWMRRFAFKRFESLHSLSLFHYQHELAKLSTDIVLSGGITSEEQLSKLRLLLRDYDDSMLKFYQIMHLPVVDDELSLRLLLNCKRAMDSNDYLMGYDELLMTDLGLGKGNDPIKTTLLNLLPWKWVANKSEQIQWNRHTQKAMSNSGGSPGFIKIFQSRGRSTHLVDRLSRMIISMLGGLLLLVPMIIMTFVNDLHWRLVTTVLFVVTFAVLAPFVSTASNQEVLGATAAYFAVLVVYMGTSSNSTN